jgi:hypothetical protein
MEESPKPYKDSTMNSNRVLVITMLCMLSCLPPARQAAALDRDMDPEQLRDISCELHQDCLNHRDTSGVKDKRPKQLQDRGRVLSKLQQGELLQELLPSGVSGQDSSQLAEEVAKPNGPNYKNKEQETGLLEELLVETSIP